MFTFLIWKYSKYSNLVGIDIGYNFYILYLRGRKMRIKNVGTNCTVVLIDGSKNYLFSFGSLVAVYNYNTSVLNVCDNHYSPTTTRHYNKWISEYKICAEEVKISRSEIESI